MYLLTFLEALAVLAVIAGLIFEDKLIRWEEVDDSMLNIKAENLTREEKMALRIVVLKMKRKRRRDKLPRLEYHLNFGDGKSISSR